MTFSYRQIRAFLQVVETGSLGRAAKNVHITQPALSRVVSELEAQCGLKLFERHPLGMRLTDAGDAFLPMAQSIMHEMERAEEAVSVMRGTGIGVVRVGAIAGIARQILPSAVRKLLDQGANIKVYVLEGSGGELADALANATIDIAIAHDNLADDDVVQFWPTGYSDCCSVVCSTEHPLANRTDCSVDEILQADWVLPRPDSTTSKLLHEVIRQTGQRMPRAVVETVSPSAVAAFVRRSMLLAWLPQSLYADEEAAGQICSIDMPSLSLHREYFVYRRRRGILSPAARLFLDAFALEERVS